MDGRLLLDVDRMVLSSVTQSPQIACRNASDDQFQHALVPISQEEKEGFLQLSLSPGPAPCVDGTTNLASSDAIVSTETDASEFSGNDTAECRICQEEENVANLETPCTCSGSVKYAHRKCVQRWCNVKGDTTCEICQQPYRSGYTAPTRSAPLNAISIEISDDWGIAGAHPIEIRDPRILAMAAAQRQFLEAEYGEYTTAQFSGAACCRSAVLILMALLLVRHALAMAAATSDEDASMFFTLFLLRAAGFLLPCYIMARAMNMLHRRRQRQEAAMAATEVAILVQAGEAGSIHFSLARGASRSHELP